MKCNEDDSKIVIKCPDRLKELKKSYLIKGGGGLNHLGRLSQPLLESVILRHI